MSCPLCQPPLPAQCLFEDERLYVILADEPGFPGFCRVIWKAHVKEMSALAPQDATYLMQWVLRTERTLIDVMQPDKINLASLGNVVPHLHWHVIPRFNDDSHFPAPVWAPAQRAGAPHDVPDLIARLQAALHCD